MMARLCAYAEKVFAFGSHLNTLTDRRPRPVIPTAAVFAAAWTMFATRRGSLHALEPDLHVPARLRGLVGPRLPSADTLGRVYALMDPEPLRQMLRDWAGRLKRNKALPSPSGWYFAALDGHEFFRQPQALLSGVFDPHAPRAGPRGHRILSPRGGLPLNRP